MAHTRKVKKVRRNVARGVVYIKATFNNTLVAITDTSGDMLAASSGGAIGFKGSRKPKRWASMKWRCGLTAPAAAGKARSPRFRRQG